MSVTVSQDFERDIVARCQRADKDAFRAIVDRYSTELHSIAVLWLRNRESAEDVTQDTFVSAWRAIDRFQPDKPLRPWLIKILTNQIRMHRRKSVRPGVRMDLDLVQDADSGRSDEWEAIASALDRLSDDQRTAVILRYYSDLSLHEIAGVTGWREGTVKSRLHRALEALREVLTRQEVAGNE